MPHKREAKPEVEKAPIQSETFFDHGDGEWAEERETRYGTVAVSSTIGTKHIEKQAPNQDAAGMVEMDGGLVLMVGDGLGGNLRGELASQIAVETICESVAKKGIKGAFREADKNITEFSLNRGLLHHRPGTVVVCAAIKNEKVQLVWTGDSMGFIIREGKFIQATITHSRKQINRRNGGLLGKSGTVTRHLGSKREFVSPSATPIIDIQDGDAILLGSDGIFKEFQLDTVPENADGTVNLEQLNDQNKDFLEKIEKANTSMELMRVIDAEVGFSPRDDATFMGLKVEKQN